ncbi:MAG: SPOR domain-containing protein [Candidatus Omnitrophota bacterium]
MERQDNPQLELFSQSNDTRGLNANAANPLLNRIWNYEKTILIIIALLATGIIAFSLGVENGKRSALTSSLAGTYTIQVAGFRDKAGARKEAEAIRKMGLSTMIFSKDGYFILCAGTFPDKDTALARAPQLKKRYVNSQIRRL